MPTSPNAQNPTTSDFSQVHEPFLQAGAQGGDVAVHVDEKDSQPPVAKAISDTVVETKQVTAMMTASDHEAFCLAAEEGDLPVVQAILERAAETGQVTEMMRAKNCLVFCVAAQRGHLSVVQAIWERATPDQVTAMIKAGSYQAFCFAAAWGHFSMVQAIWEKAPDHITAMLAAEGYAAFRLAVMNGHLAVVQAILEKATETGQVTAMIARANYEAFRMAAEHGDLPVMRVIWERATPDQITAMIEAWEYWAFHMAAARRDFAVVQAILEKATDAQLLEMLAAHTRHPCYAANQTDILHLLLPFPCVFAHVEQHIQERGYGNYVRSFIQAKLTELHQRADRGKPTGVVFTQEEAKLCFYILRHLIKSFIQAKLTELHQRADHGKPTGVVFTQEEAKLCLRHLIKQRSPLDAQLADIRFLINIPAVRDIILHRPISPNAPSESSTPSHAPSRFDALPSDPDNSLLAALVLSLEDAVMDDAEAGSAPTPPQHYGAPVARGEPRPRDTDAGPEQDVGAEDDSDSQTPMR